MGVGGPGCPLTGVGGPDCCPLDGPDGGPGGPLFICGGPLMGGLGKGGPLLVILGGPLIGTELFGGLGGPIAEGGPIGGPEGLI